MRAPVGKTGLGAAETRENQRKVNALRPSSHAANSLRRLFRGSLTIRRNGDHLVWQGFGRNALQGALDVYPESETNFFLKINGAQVTFIKNDKGEVTAVIHHMAGLPDREGKKLNNE